MTSTQTFKLNLIYCAGNSQHILLEINTNNALRSATKNRLTVNYDLRLQSILPIKRQFKSNVSVTTTTIVLKCPTILKYTSCSKTALDSNDI